MTTLATEQIAQAWDNLQSLIPVSPIRDEQQYDQALEKLHELLDIVGDDERHPLYEVLDTLGTLVHAYEENHYQASPVTGVDVLKFLMDEHQLDPTNFPELGSKETVFELLNGKRELSVENIRILSKRFGLSPATFF